MKNTKIFLLIFFLFCLLFSIPISAQFFQERLDSIAVGDSASAGVDMKGMRLVAIIAPDTLEVDTISLWTSEDNVTWKKVYINEGGGAVSKELKIVLVAGKYNVIAPKEGYFLRRFVKIQYGGSAYDTDASGANDLFKIIIGYY